MDVRAAEARIGETIDRYRLEGVLGVGGFGAVYRARHLVMDRPVALKLLHTVFGGSDDLRERFLGEARTLARLGHPNVVTVYDCGISARGEVFLAMELLEGEDLATRLERLGRMPSSDALALTDAVLEGLSAAHEAGIVHRDLKPGNVFLVAARPPSAGAPPTPERAKLVDFGISKLGQGQGLTRTGTAIGTPIYMAPECFLVGSAAVDHRVDLYAVGVMLFEMLSGQLPYDATSYEGLVVKIATEPPMALSRVAPALPSLLVAFVERAFARRPDERFGSAAEMRAALARVRDELGNARTLAASSVDLGSPGISSVAGGDWGTAGTLAAPSAELALAARGTGPVSWPSPAGDAGARSASLAYGAGSTPTPGAGAPNALAIPPTGPLAAAPLPSTPAPAWPATPTGSPAPAPWSPSVASPHGAYAPAPGAVTPHGGAAPHGGGMTPHGGGVHAMSAGVATPNGMAAGAATPHGMAGAATPHGMAVGAATPHGMMTPGGGGAASKARAGTPWGWIGVALGVPILLVVVLGTFVMVCHMPRGRRDVAEVPPTLGQSAPSQATPHAASSVAAPAHDHKPPVAPPTGPSVPPPARPPEAPPAASPTPTPAASPAPAPMVDTAPTAPAPRRAGVRFREPRVIGQVPTSPLVARLDARKTALQRCRDDVDRSVRVQVHFGLGQVRLTRPMDGEDDAGRCAANVLRELEPIADASGIVEVRIDLAARDD